MVQKDVNKFLADDRHVVRLPFTILRRISKIRQKVRDDYKLWKFDLHVIKAPPRVKENCLGGENYKSPLDLSMS